MERILRPPAHVLADSAIVPEANLVRPSPSPDEFTHQTMAGQPYYYSEPGETSPPVGSFAAGTKVVLKTHAHGDVMCEVVDGQGLRVFTAFSGLRALR